MKDNANTQTAGLLNSDQMNNYVKYLQQNQQGSAQPTQQPQPQAPQNKGNFFTRLFPTMGGILGGLAGGAADVASLGALAPLVNPITGAAAGGALGQEAENLTTGTKGNIGVAAAENAIGSGVGGIAGKAIGAIAGKVGSVAGNTATNSLMKQFGGFLTRDDAQSLIDRGITNAQQIKEIAPQITGGAGGKGAAYTNAVTNTMNTAKQPLDINQEIANVRDLIRPHSASLTDKQVNDLSANITHVTSKMAADTGQQVTNIATKGTSPNLTALEPGALSNMNTGAVYSGAQELQKLGNTIESNAPKDVFGNITDPVKAAQSDIYKTLGNQLEQKATSSVPLEVTDKSALKEAIAPIQKQNPDLYKSLASDIDSASTWQDIISQQGVMVRASKALDAMGNIANKTVGSTPTDVLAKGTLGMTTGKMGLAKAGVGSTLGGPTMNQVETSLLSGLSKALQNPTVQKAIPLATRSAGIAAMNTPNMAQGAAAQNNVQSGVDMNNIAQMGQNPLSQLYQQLLTQEQVAPTVMGPTLAPVLQALAPQVQKQSLMAPGIENTLNTFANAGGAQGMGGGLLSKLSGLIPGTAANTYNNASTAAAAQLAQLLGISPQQAQAMLPQLMQNQQTTAPQVGGLQSILGGIGTTPSAIPAQ